MVPVVAKVKFGIANHSHDGHRARITRTVTHVTLDLEYIDILIVSILTKTKINVYQHAYNTTNP